MVQLTPEHIQALKDLEDHHAMIRAEIEKAKSAGLDMSDHEAKLETLENIRAGILKVYGTPSRRRSVG